jgi:glutamine amidotransferase of anthranilate synthase or aminodeoxychorismate synthase
MILIIDNYDSFTYNLYQLTGQLQPDIRVIYNDEMGMEDIKALHPSHIIISPGAGRPSEAGCCNEVIRSFAGKIPILGICLGHQAICETFGATITYAKTLMHGKKSIIQVDNNHPIFHDLSPLMEVGRYHSLAVKHDTLPNELFVIAKADDCEIMAVKHRDFNIYGLQFHPESILTPKGKTIFKNFIGIKKG